MRGEIMFTLKLMLVIVVLSFLAWLLCGCRTTPPAREYEVEYYIEIDGKIVQRVRGKAREIIPKEPLK